MAMSEVRMKDIFSIYSQVIGLSAITHGKPAIITGRMFIGGTLVLVWLKRGSDEIVARDFAEIEAL
jgi:hypothetical protein